MGDRNLKILGMEVLKTDQITDYSLSLGVFIKDFREL